MKKWKIVQLDEAMKKEPSINLKIVREVGVIESPTKPSGYFTFGGRRYEVLEKTLLGHIYSALSVFGYEPNVIYVFDLYRDDEDFKKWCEEWYPTKSDDDWYFPHDPKEDYDGHG